MPIFLLWIYVLWIVVLMGATLTASLTTFHVGGLNWSWSKRFEFPLLLRLLHHLWSAQAKGEVLSMEMLNLKEPSATHDQVTDLVNTLNARGLVRFDEQNRLILAADLEEWSVGDIYHLGAFVLPLDEISQLPRSDAMDERIIEFFQSLKTDMPAMDQPIKSLVAQPAKERL